MNTKGDILLSTCSGESWPMSRVTLRVAAGANSGGHRENIGLSAVKALGGGLIPLAKRQVGSGDGNIVSPLMLARV